MFNKIRFNFLLWEYNSQRQNKKHFCIAPYSSLYFDYKGNVFACFANKHFVLGKYSKQSIFEIWNSETIKELRKSLDNYSFEHGCHLCKNKLLQQKFTQVYARRYDYLTPTLNNFPTSIEIQLSNKCNLNCIMCVVTKDNHSKIEIKKFRTYLQDAIPYLKNASFSGGEPFFIDEYFDIWEDFSNLNPDCRISVNTNATILNDKVKAILNKLSFNISVSVDGLTKDTFENIRLNSNKDKVYENLEYLMQYAREKKTFFNVKICALNQNIQEFPILFEFFNKKEISVILNEVGYPLKTALWNNKSSKIKEIVNFLLKNTPTFPKSSAGYNNATVWKELLKMLYDYYKTALSFENFLLKKKCPENDLKKFVFKRLTSFFANTDDLNYFMSIIENQTYKENARKRIFNFFLIAPYERIIGEIEVRNEEEVNRIFNAIVNDFVWE